MRRFSILFGVMLIMAVLAACAPSAPPATPAELPRHFTSTNGSFDYPDGWVIDQSHAPIVILASDATVLEQQLQDNAPDSVPKGEALITVYILPSFGVGDSTPVTLLNELRPNYPMNTTEPELITIGDYRGAWIQDGSSTIDLAAYAVDVGDTIAIINLYTSESERDLFRPTTEAIIASIALPEE